MTLADINRKLAWAVLVTGVFLTALSAAFAMVAESPGALLFTAVAAVAAQVGRVGIRNAAEVEAPRPEVKNELVPAA